MANSSSASSVLAAPALQHLGRHRGLLFPIACLALLAVLLVPLPAALLDLLLVLNLTVSVLLLVTAIYVRSPLEFAVLPSLLLATTLFRLTLNVATTRLILTAGAPGTPPEASLGDAGQVVQAFSQVVTGGSLAVGFVIFLIIFVIQFVVITKGATRISEVAARFTLDAMPGRQMAIDADVNAGHIDDKEARRRREEIREQADFYGAMDGASKFVRGDAIAGVLITIVNVVGGMYVGVMENRWGVGETAELYTRLTIGDGLVSQVPAFITAMGCGLILTRAGSRTELGEQVVTQLLSSARPLWVAAAFLLCLGLTGLPLLPLVTLAACCGGLAWMLGRSQAVAAAADLDSEPSKAPSSTAAPMESLLELEAIELEVGRGLVRLAEPEKGGDLMDRIATLRREVAGELGLIVPPIRIRDNPAAGPTDYVVKLRGMAVARGEAYPDQFLAIRTPEALGPILHAAEHADPAGGQPAYWITEPQVEEARRLKYTIHDAAEALVQHLGVIVRRHAHVLLTRQDVRDLLDNLKKAAPALVEEVVGPQVKPGEIHRVLQNLLKEGVPIRDLETILETLGESVADTRDPAELTERCRAALAPAICHRHAADSNVLACVTFDGPMEELVYSHIYQAEGRGGMLPPDLAQQTVSRIRSAVAETRASGRNPVVLCAPQIRPAIRRMLEGPLPQVAVLGYNELVPELRLEAAMIGLEA
jgi:flagellar biosynthesis protein FlhA